MIKCKLCELECKNKVGLIRHTKSAHNKTLEEFKVLYKELYPKKEKTEDMIECKICGYYAAPLGMPSHLSRKHNLSTKEYYDIYCKSDNEGKCKICGKSTSFNGIYGYRDYCSSKCANLDPNVQQKLKNTFTEKYGVEHPLKSEQIKEHMKQTNIERYGVDSVLKLERVREKTIESITSKEVVEKRIATNIERYGAENPFSSKEIQDKIKQNNLKKYGSENIYSSEYGKQKIKETNLERYGCTNGGASKQAQLKIKETKTQKSIEFCNQNDCIPLTELNVNYSVKDSIFHNKLLLFNDRYYVKISDIDEIINHTPQSTGQSVTENNIFNFIKSIYNGTIIKNTRTIIKPLELDIYIPDKKLAIEFNGTYWHSIEIGMPKDYHLYKSLACREKGIRLIHIYEFEDLEQQKQLLKNLINGMDHYNVNDFNKNNLINEIPKPCIIYQDSKFTIYGAGPLIS